MVLYEIAVEDTFKEKFENLIQNLNIINSKNVVRIKSIKKISAEPKEGK